MAESKTKEKKTTAKKTTAKKTTKKSKPKTIQLTFKPMTGSSVKRMKIQLRKKEWQNINGRQVERNVPLIEGLPEYLVVEKDEIIEVTPDQYDALVDMKCVETEEEYQKRLEFVDNLGKQHPQKLTYDQIEEDYVNGASIRRFEEFYKDKLIRV